MENFNNHVGATLFDKFRIQPSKVQASGDAPRQHGTFTVKSFAMQDDKRIPLSYNSPSAFPLPTITALPPTTPRSHMVRLNVISINIVNIAGVIRGSILHARTRASVVLCTGS